MIYIEFVMELINCDHKEEKSADNADCLTYAECPKCGHKEAYWVLRQTRSSDEPETRIYTCTKCEHRWRVY